MRKSSQTRPCASHATCERSTATSAEVSVANAEAAEAKPKTGQNSDSTVTFTCTGPAPGVSACLTCEAVAFSSLTGQQ